MTSTNGNTVDEIIKSSACEYNGRRVFVDPDTLIEKLDTYYTTKFLELVGEDYNRDILDGLDRTEDWEYYDDYSSNAYDFIKGLNKTKAELRARIKEKMGL